MDKQYSTLSTGKSPETRASYPTTLQSYTQLQQVDYTDNPGLHTRPATIHENTNKRFFCGFFTMELRHFFESDFHNRFFSINVDLYNKMTGIREQGKIEHFF